MKNCILCLSLCLVFASCKTLQVAEDRNPKNVKSIGVEWIVEEQVNPFYKDRIDAEMAVEMEHFNSEKHLFTVHKKEKREKDYITITFTRGRKVRMGTKIAGYAVSAIGLIATPILLLSVEPPSFGLFWWFPANKLSSSLAMSPSLSASNNHDKQFYIETNTLFANTDKQAEKLLRKFGLMFHTALNKIDMRVAAHK